MLQIADLSVRYGELEALAGFSLHLEEGRIHVLIGPSGCGKSTLLRVLCGIQPPSSGRIVYKGEPLRPDRIGSGHTRPDHIRIGYVPQNYGLLPWKTLRQNIFLPLHVGKGRRLFSTAFLRAAWDEEASAVIEALGLRDILDRLPGEVSGGQQQRAALARAVIPRPDLLLMDEPFSALDAFTSEASQALFLQLRQRHRPTTLLITHNMHEAAALGEKILIMMPGAGVIRCFENTSFSPDSAAGGAEDAARRYALIAAMSEELRRGMSQ